MEFAPAAWDQTKTNDIQIWEELTVIRKIRIGGSFTKL